MAEILVLESEERYRDLLRFILEGINHRVLEARDRDSVPFWCGGAAEPAGSGVKGPDLIILGVHLEGSLGDGPLWLKGLPEAPVLVLFSGDPDLKEGFIKAWEGTPAINYLDHPVDPYPFLAMVKAMLTAPVEWRRGGQHAL